MIQMPLREAFRDGSQYWATLAHEIAHAAPHETGLNRHFGQTRFGDNPSSFRATASKARVATVRDQASQMGS